MRRPRLLVRLLTLCALLGSGCTTFGSRESAMPAGQVPAERLVPCPTSSQPVSPDLLRKPSGGGGTEPREWKPYRVTVLRQDVATAPPVLHPLVRTLPPGMVTTGLGVELRHQGGYSLDLRPGDNDVWHALDVTGGLPESDGVNTVLVYRSERPPAGSLRAAVERRLEQVRPPGATTPAETPVRIPLRIDPDGPLPFGPDDVVLHDGDVLMIESRGRGFGRPADSRRPAGHAPS